MKNILSFLSKDSVLPLLAGLASGLYPMAFYYSKNFKFVNSWTHFSFFISTFLLLPIAINYLLYFIFKKKSLTKYKNTLLPFLNALTFGILIFVAIYSGISTKKLALAIFGAILFAFLCTYFKKLFTKIIIFQFILLGVVFYPLASKTGRHLLDNEKWMIQPDAIENIKLVNKPNIYVIQPDGYVNQTELNKGHYQFDNRSFYTWLEDTNFVLYPNIRSNYPSTLTSNSSLFAMKHHYFGYADNRAAIMTHNPVLHILKKNNYKTHFLAEVPYLLANRPQINFDYTNIKKEEIPLLGKGFGVNKNIINDLTPLLKNQTGSNFYFIEKLLPGHISTYKDASKSIAQERQEYLDKLQNANQWLQEIISLILKNDENALVVILADHGGFVGWEYSQQCSTKSREKELINSIFSTMLAIKWNNNLASKDMPMLKTHVNFFRVLLSHLSQDDRWLQNMQENGSYLEIKKAAPRGIYQVLDDQGKVVFKETDK